MHSRPAVSPIIASIVLLVLGIVIAGTVWRWDHVGSREEQEVYHLEFISVRLAHPVSVGNAGWQIEIIVRNGGNVDDTVDRVYVNRELASEMGLVSGDSLSSDSDIGTDIPVGGLVLHAGQSARIHVWVGGGLFSRGTQVTIELQRPNQIELKKYVTLS